MANTVQMWTEIDDMEVEDIHIIKYLQKKEKKKRKKKHGVKATLKLAIGTLITYTAVQQYFIEFCFLLYMLYIVISCYNSTLYSYTIEKQCGMLTVYLNQQTFYHFVTK